MEGTIASASSSGSHALGSRESPAMTAVIEKIGMGLAQVRAVVVGGGTYFADGAELLMISSVAAIVSKEWNMNPIQRGLVISFVFVGILVGNMMSGPIGDSFGRRQLILSGYAGVFFFSIMSSITHNVWQLTVVRFFVGLSFGIGLPAWNSLSAEITPARWRMVVQSSSQALFIFGEVYSCILLMIDDTDMKALHWRWQLRMGAIPATAFGIASYFLLHQSPAFLALKGRHVEATAVLKSMQHDNGAPDFELSYRNPKRSSGGVQVSQLSILFGRKLLISTAIVVYSCFVLNFVYYGSMYAFAVIIPEAEGGKISSAVKLLIGALWEFPGMLLGALPVKRKLMMRLYLVTAMTSLILFGIGHQHSWPVPMDIGYCMIKCVVNCGFVVLYQYTTEVYPTEVRTSGAGFAFAGGRVAGIVCPLVFEVLRSKTGSPDVFFYVSASFCFINLFVIGFLKYETFEMPLKDYVSDDSEDPDQTHEPDEVQPILSTRKDVASGNGSMADRLS